MKRRSALPNRPLWPGKDFILHFLYDLILVSGIKWFTRSACLSLGLPSVSCKSHKSWYFQSSRSVYLCRFHCGVLLFNLQLILMLSCRCNLVILMANLYTQLTLTVVCIENHAVHGWLVISSLQWIPILVRVYIYTLNHKKHDILFLTITLANLNRFL